MAPQLPNKVAYFTICSTNYLAYAKTLKASLLASQPDACFYIFLADDHEHSLIAGEDIISLSDLSLPNLWDMALRYSITEFNTSIKPSCFKYLFDAMNHDAAIYLDPDVYILQPLSLITQAFANGANAVLTPHICAPLADSEKPSDFDILKSGIYNLGFIALTASPGARQFLNWWEEQLKTCCLINIENGLFVDQKFADFVPAMIQSTTIIHHQGYNTAYWNLKHRPIDKKQDLWTAGGEPLCFFHFSGIKPKNPEIFSSHQTRFDIADIGPLKSLMDEYIEQLWSNGHAYYSKIPYAFDYYLDGERIPAAARRLYGKAAPAPATLSRTDAFTPNYSLMNKPSQEVDHDTGALITELMMEIWRMRPDLQTKFAMGTKTGRTQFYSWFLRHGLNEYELPKSCVHAIKENSSWSLRGANKIKGYFGRK